MDLPPPQLVAHFQKMFGGGESVSQAPGRVNIIGEHTDYNDGFVLPAATNFRCWIAFSPRRDRKVLLYSQNTRDSASADLEQLRPSHVWSDYPLGVAAELEHYGCRVCGANLYIHSQVPLGAGLSSSAAIEVATAYALLHAGNCVMSSPQIAQLCQRAENNFVGVRCGIMDQFTSSMGQAGNALLLDCRSLEYQPVPIPPQIALVICNTMVKHELGGGEYNSRRRECENGVRILAAVLPGIRALRDASISSLEKHRNLLPTIVYRRCRHVISENERVHKMANALRDVDTESMTALMAESHASLRDDFEVSCEELDVLVDLARRQRDVFGARMMGGGFGGCTINLVDASAIADFKNNVSAGYFAATGQKPEIYICSPSEGAGVVSRC